MDEISEYFVHKTINKIEDKTGREYTKRVQTKIQENADKSPTQFVTFMNN